MPPGWCGTSVTPAPSWSAARSTDSDADLRGSVADPESHSRHPGRAPGTARDRAARSAVGYRRCGRWTDFVLSLRHADRLLADRRGFPHRRRAAHSVDADIGQQHALSARDVRGRRAQSPQPPAGRYAVLVPAACGGRAEPAAVPAATAPVALHRADRDFFFFKQKTAYEVGLGIPAEPLFRSPGRPQPLRGTKGKRKGARLWYVGGQQF